MTRRIKSPRTNGAGAVRCAIYTRKSSEEGLEQDFNSLDAQREACEAFITSQKGAGWSAVPTLYDDGGFSGGTLDRAALQRLLCDIEAGKIDTIVVYKVDRLTRSLSDFAKIIDVFDAKGVSFVSVTQQFNTTTSMGRLTLNMLLSFAQFEREVTSERIRDKIAASKQKGMWMGGVAPLGYDVDDRKLVVNNDEANTVRHIFHRYAKLKSVRALKEELDRENIVSKVRTDRHGNRTGGKPLTRGVLYLMLQNRVYRGEIVHKDKAYPGLHDPIIEEAVWDQVQAALTDNRVTRQTQSKAANASLLAGFVFDAGGERMSPTHANKKGTRYRYYVSQSLIKRRREKASDAACRIPAADLEKLVDDQIVRLMRDEPLMHKIAGEVSVAQRKRLISQSVTCAKHWHDLPTSERRARLNLLLERVVVHRETVTMTIKLNAFPIVTTPDLNIRKLPSQIEGPTQQLSIPARLRRTGMETKLLVQGVTGARPQRHHDRSLLRLIARAYQFRDMVMTSNGKPIRELAVEANITPSYFTGVFRLSFLAPAITEAILKGRQSSSLNAIALTRIYQLEPNWSAQQRQLQQTSKSNY